jgi:hypothetical protein
VSVLPSNRDGTFQTAVSYGTGGTYALSVAMADVNGDDVPDVVANECGSNISCRDPGSVGVLINTSLTPTTTALGSSQNPSSFGQAVTFTATVTAQPGFYKGSPTGTVSFFDSATSTNLGSFSLNTSGVASVQTSTLGPSTHSIIATYSR